MKKQIVISSIFFHALSVFAEDSFQNEMGLNDVYRAADGLAQYVHKKDSSISEDEAYRIIIDNFERKGPREAIVIPVELFLLQERDIQKAGQLKEIILNMGEKHTPVRPHKNIDIVANVSDECISKCIDDVLNGAAKGAGIGATIGSGGGPATSGAAAAAGAAIGGSLGGVQCSVSKECKDDKQKKIVVPKNHDIDRSGVSVADFIKAKRNVVVNNGPRGSRGGF